MKIAIIKYIPLLFLTSILISCNSSNKSAENNAPVETEEASNLVHISKAQFTNANMKLGTLLKQRFTEGIKTNGHIDVPPVNRAQVSAMMGGYIKKSPLLIGDQVKKGQLLMIIENPDFIEIQQDYLETYETIKFLKSDFERQKTLFEEKITSEKNYLKAESVYKSSLAKLNGFTQKLKLININPATVLEGNITSTIPVYAPIAGSISSVNVSVGKYMSASEVLLEIIDSSHKHLELVVFEKDVLSVEKGQLIEFQIPENSLQTYDAEVHLIGKSIDEENRTVKVHGHIDDEKDPFLVGMFVEAEIITYTTEKMALPINAVLEENYIYYIMILKNIYKDAYEFEKKMVHIGLKNDNYIEIIDVDQTLKDKQLLIKGAFFPLEESSGGHSH